MLFINDMTSSGNSVDNSALVELHDICGKVKAVDARVDLIFEEIQIVAIINEEKHKKCKDGILTVKLSSSFYADNYATVSLDESVLRQSYHEDGFFRTSIWSSKIDGGHWKAGFSKYRVNIALVVSSKCLLDGECSMLVNTSLTIPEEKYEFRSILPSNCIIGSGFGLTFVCPDRGSTLYSTVGDKSSILIVDLAKPQLEAARESLTIILSAVVGALVSTLVGLIGFERIAKRYEIRKPAESGENSFNKNDEDDEDHEDSMISTLPSQEKSSTLSRKQTSSPGENSESTNADDASWRDS
ncbi:hypothetical protein ACN9JG_18960 (plasmid) [Cereibacter azotoformans]|uniref:hypothetical protein n=1 Tax=Cereibacter azotoformans TaxID=43057 RepID=UPI003B2107BD